MSLSKQIKMYFKKGRKSKKIKKINSCLKNSWENNNKHKLANVKIQFNAGSQNNPEIFFYQQKTLYAECRIKTKEEKIENNVYLLAFWFRNQERQRHKSLLSYFLQRMHHLCYRLWSRIEYAMLKKWKANDNVI